MLRRRTQPDSLDQVLDSVANAGRPDQVPAGLSDPVALALEAEARREVVAALDRLPERYRQVLVLKDGCGLRSGEIADLLDTTVPSTKSVLFRARRMLREELASA
jgi:RNA polymerase sigma-70 factor (ECF subfamily)